MTESEYLTPQQVAELLGVTVKTIANWQKEGRLIPALTLPTGHRRYSRQQIEELLTKMKGQK